MSSAEETAWKSNTLEALVNACGSNAPNVDTFNHVGIFVGAFGGGNETTWEQDRAETLDKRLKILEGTIELLASKAEILGTANPGQKPIEQEVGTGVFLVHGHNEAILHETARFLESLDLDTIVLREQPNQGRTN